MVDAVGQDSERRIASAPCAVCSATGLSLYLRVAGTDGPQGLVPTTDRFGTALGDIVRCPSCGHMQVAPMPPGEDLRESYAEAESDAYLDEAAGQRATARRVLEALEAHIRPGRLLDLGCWVGFLLDEASRRGWQGTGVEPSEFASGFARAQLGLDVQTAELFDAELPLHEFDAVILGDVIEHLPDPGAALEELGRLLKPGGIVVLMLPDAGSRVARLLGRRWWSVIPTHVQYFTRGTIARLLRDQGFQPLVMTTQPKAFTMRYYLERIGGYSPTLSRLLVRSAVRLHLAERLWAPDFRDRMLVLARRAGSEHQTAAP